MLSLPRLQKLGLRVDDCAQIRARRTSLLSITLFVDAMPCVAVCILAEEVCSFSLAGDGVLRARVIQRRVGKYLPEKP